jgi:hypothetical protein
MSKRYQAGKPDYRYTDEMKLRRLRDLIRRDLYRVPSEEVAEAVLPFIVDIPGSLPQATDGGLRSP